MSSLQQQARALGDPTRHGIFRYIADADEQVSIAELTSWSGLNHNAIRQHLAKLLDAGLVIESTVQSGGPGRPRLLYQIDPATESRWGVLGPYERLSLLLTEIISTGDTPQEVGRRAGQKYLASAVNPDDAVDVMAEAMARLGFDPEVRRKGKCVDIVLDTCPFATAALADPDTICSLHLGMAQGIAEGSGTVVDELITKDPQRAKCRLRLHTDEESTLS